MTKNGRRPGVGGSFSRPLGGLRREPAPSEAAAPADATPATPRHNGGPELEHEAGHLLLIAGDHVAVLTRAGGGRFAVAHLGPKGMADFSSEPMVDFDDACEWLEGCGFPRRGVEMRLVDELPPEITGWLALARAAAASGCGWSA